MTVFVAGSSATAAQELVLTSNDASSDDRFGTALALDGDTLVVGTPADWHGSGPAGAAYVFVRQGAGWVQEAKLKPAVGPVDADFGRSVAIDGDTIVVGAPDEDVPGGFQAGSAFVFVRSGGLWTEQAKLVNPEPANNDYFGRSVAVSGETIAVGADYDDVPGMPDAGSVSIFVTSGESWTLQAKLKALGATINDSFGVSIALSGEMLLVGVQHDDLPSVGLGGKQNAGSVRVFERSGGAWSETATLVPADAKKFDGFGNSVAFEGDTAVIGAGWDDHLGVYGSGSATVFRRLGSAWIEEASLGAWDPMEEDHFGYSVAVHDDIAVIGSTWDDHEGLNITGSAYVFQRVGTQWTQLAKWMPPDAEAFDYAGFAVAVSNDEAIVGVPYDSHAVGLDAGSVRVVPLAGFPPGTWTNLGQALAGLAGEPHLTGSGSLLAGATVRLELESARPHVPGILVVGLSLLGAPFHGGVMLPNVDGYVGSVLIDAAGTWSAEDEWPGGVPSGTPLWYQVWVQDDAGPVGFAASNGVKSVTP